jgi:hypothetical protein
VPRSGRLLIVDDVCTEGSTLECTAEALLATPPKLKLIAGTAAQMAVRTVVNNDNFTLRAGSRSRGAISRPAESFGSP